jgi:hypothetical protein
METSNCVPRRTIPLVVAVLIAAPAAKATTVRSIDPLKGVTAIAIEIVLGDPIRVDEPEAVPLFNTDHVRADAFISATRSSLAATLSKSRIGVKSGATHTLVLSFYGGSSPRLNSECGSVFLLEIAIVKQPNADQESEILYQRSVLGTFESERPEEALGAAVGSVLKDLLNAHSD